MAIIPVDFGARPSNPLDHAVREAARVYGDQLFQPGHVSGPLAVRLSPPGAAYPRRALISHAQVADIDPASLALPVFQEVAERVDHEIVVALIAALAFQRRVAPSTDMIVETLLEPGSGAFADAMATYRWLTPSTVAGEHQLLLALRMGQANRFLDRNWHAIVELATRAMKVRPAADGWAIMSPLDVEAWLLRRPAKLADAERDWQNRRRIRNNSANAKAIVEQLGIGR